MTAEKDPIQVQALSFRFGRCALVNGPEGCGAQLNSRQAGTVLIVMTEITRNLSGIRDGQERLALYGALAEGRQEDKPIPISQ